MIGVSHDDIGTLNKFSVSECQSKFPVAADQDRRVMKSYDATMSMLLSYASRTSYVVSQDGKIAFAPRLFRRHAHQVLPLVPRDSR